MKSEMRWPIGIVVILATSVLGNLAFMRLANSDPSFAVEPDYYTRAVAFDTTMQETRLSNALGWTATASIDSVHENQGIVRLKLHDQTNTPVVVDSVRVAAFFNGRANDVTRTMLTVDTSRGRGSYSARIPITHVGQWQLHIDARRGAEHFVTSMRTEVVRATDASVPRAHDTARYTRE